MAPHKLCERHTIVCKMEQDGKNKVRKSKNEKQKIC